VQRLNKAIDPGRYCRFIGVPSVRQVGERDLLSGYDLLSSFLLLCNYW
jgi:hypothetical protein